MTVIWKTPHLLAADPVNTCTCVCTRARFSAAAKACRSHARRRKVTADRSRSSIAYRDKAFYYKCLRAPRTQHTVFARRHRVAVGALRARKYAKQFRRFRKRTSRRIRDETSRCARDARRRKYDVRKRPTTHRPRTRNGSETNDFDRRS